ncbi:MAG: TlpA family protein disulfide reductase [Woeseia sp.]|jgi:thiol-disulfide isomerase/thioredoxin|nr:TlpA family protein disulfide reductase [Woeseia sp.]MBT6210620.1 TlpA family protein disulfide reductase [Woeseia sp.]
MLKKCFPTITTLALVVLATVYSETLHADDSLDLLEYRDKVVVVDFWASWCVPCRRSFPWMNEMQEKYADSGLVIIGINVDTEESAIDSFLRDYPVNFKIVRDPNGDVARSFDVVAMPSSYVFGKDGSLIATHLGFKVKKQREYESILLTALRNDTE